MGNSSPRLTPQGGANRAAQRVIHQRSTDRQGADVHAVNSDCFYADWDTSVKSSGR